jgi:D-alanyl-D-alanine carboxypeptidase
MVWPLLCALLLWTFFVPVAATTASSHTNQTHTTIAEFDPGLVAALDQALDRVMADPSVPGVLLAVDVPGKGTWSGARGMAHRAANLPMTPNDRFRIASVTKVFVATVVLQLAQEGRLTLDDPVGMWLPGLVPYEGQMTIRHLLNHTSGLYNYMDSAFMRKVRLQPDHSWAPAELAAYSTARRMYFPPGAPGLWRYSNTNYVVLGMIVERVTNSPLAAEIRWRVLDRLGMRDTFFEGNEDVPGGVAHGYVGWRDRTNVNMTFAWAAGNMVSTVSDLRIFARAVCDGSLLNPDALAAMHSFVGVNGAWGAKHLVYGMGIMQDVMTVSAPDGRPPEVAGVMRGHTGALGGYRTAMWHQPETGITIVVGVTQMYADPNEIVTTVLDAILDHQAASG